MASQSNRILKKALADYDDLNCSAARIFNLIMSVVFSGFKRAELMR